jgi:hypothetical protein
MGHRGCVRARNINSDHRGSFDLKRLSNSKESVDLAPNTIRAFAKRGLRLYRHGKMVFFSQSELEDFIRTPTTTEGLCE